MRNMYRYVPSAFWIDEETAFDLEYSYETNEHCVSEYISSLAATQGQFGTVSRDIYDKCIEFSDDGSPKLAYKLKEIETVEPPLEPLEKWLDESWARRELRAIIEAALMPQAENIVYQETDGETAAKIVQCFGYDDFKDAKPSTIKLYDLFGNPITIDLLSVLIEPINGGGEFIKNVKLVVHLPEKDVVFFYNDYDFYPADIECTAAEERGVLS